MQLVARGLALHRVEVVVYLLVVGKYRHIRQRLQDLKYLVDMRLPIGGGKGVPAVGGVVRPGLILALEAAT